MFLDNNYNAYHYVRPFTRLMTPYLHSVDAHISCCQDLFYILFDPVLKWCTTLNYVCINSSSVVFDSYQTPPARVLARGLCFFGTTLLIAHRPHGSQLPVSRLRFRHARWDGPGSGSRPIEWPYARA